MGVKKYHAPRPILWKNKNIYNVYIIFGFTWCEEFYSTNNCGMASCNHTFIFAEIKLVFLNFFIFNFFFFFLHLYLSPGESTSCYIQIPQFMLTNVAGSAPKQLSNADEPTSQWSRKPVDVCAGADASDEASDEQWKKQLMHYTLLNHSHRLICWFLRSPLAIGSCKYGICIYLRYQKQHEVVI